MEAEKVRTRERTPQWIRLNLPNSRPSVRRPPPNFRPRPLVTYGRIRKKWKGSVVITEAVEGRCTACQIVLRPQYMQDLKRGEELMLCESCGRFLYYTRPVSFEDVAKVG